MSVQVQIEEQGVVPVKEEELETYDLEVQRFRSGENEPTAFQAYRLREGVYGQRQPDAQMFRVKIPGGILTAKQLEALADVAGRYAALGKGHITTRENIQFHHMTLEDAGEAKWRIAKVGLTSREACGNTVRNVVTCPLAGVCRNEAFDVTPYLTAYVRYFIRKPFTQAMPRKFKTSYSPCPSDCAVAPFHDLGFIAQVREVNGELRKGFRMHVGGGSSIMPRVAPVLYDFVPVEEYLRISEAVLRVFNKSDEMRKNRMMARVKVLIDRIGIEAFRELVEKELQEPWAQEPADPTEYMLKHYEKVPPPYQYGNRPEEPGQSEAEFLRWKMTNAVPQRQPGYYAVYLKVAAGDLSAQQLAALAELSRRYGNGTARTTAEQNLVLRWVPRHELHALWKDLSAINLGEGGANEITDVTSCPGTDSCKLGITAAMGAGRALRQSLLDMEIQDPLVKALHVKVSGCPNGCGRHHLASIGFQGAAVKGDEGHQVPAYEVYVGGHYEDGDFRYGQRVVQKVPSKRVPEATQRILALYQEQRQQDEPFHLFVDRVGLKAFETVLADLRGATPMADNLDLYQDWERMEIYKLERGEGECAV